MQLTSYGRLTPDNIIFNEAKEYKVKDSKIRYKRIPIKVKYPDGKKGQLIISNSFLLWCKRKEEPRNKQVSWL